MKKEQKMPEFEKSCDFIEIRFVSFCSEVAWGATSQRGKNKGNIIVPHLHFSPIVQPASQTMDKQVHV